MILMGCSPLFTAQVTLDSSEQLPADGRQSLAIEEECEGLKFEDLFNYDFANFIINVVQDGLLGQGQLPLIQFHLRQKTCCSSLECRDEGYLHVFLRECP